MKYDSFKVFNVYIEFEEKYEESIAASMSEEERKKFVRNSSPIDSWEDLVGKIIDFLEAEGFKIDKFKPSNVEGSLSRYIFCHRVDDETDKTIACEFNIRVSDHKLVSPSEQRRRKRFRLKEKPLIEKSTSKTIEHVAHPFIFYNHKRYSDFDVFFNDVTQEILKWRNKYGH